MLIRWCDCTYNIHGTPCQEQRRWSAPPHDFVHMLSSDVGCTLSTAAWAHANNNPCLCVLPCGLICSDLYYITLLVYYTTKQTLCSCHCQLNNFLLYISVSEPGADTWWDDRLPRVWKTVGSIKSFWWWSYYTVTAGYIFARSENPVPFSVDTANREVLRKRKEKKSGNIKKSMETQLLDPIPQWLRVYWENSSVSSWYERKYVRKLSFLLLFATQNKKGDTK